MDEQAYHRSYYVAHREALLAKMRAYYLAHRGAILVRKSAYNFANRETISAKMRIWNKAHPETRASRIALNRAFVDGELARGCLDCGTKEQAVLDFDHVRGAKVNNISVMVTGSRQRLLNELDKCEVRCANCHRRATSMRRLVTSG